MAVYVGDLLTASAAPVSGKPTPTRTWQWLRGSTAISGATSSTYTVAEADLGQTLSVKQIETNIAGSAEATSLTVGPVETFTVASLFASGEEGAWYEPSTTTAFRSTTDLTPCGYGDLCGFLLDKSQGAGYSGGSFTGLGSELVTNGGFDADTDWVKGAGWTISAGVASFTYAGIGGSITQTVSITSGQTYLVELTAVTGAGVVVSLGGGATFTTLQGGGTNDYSFTLIAGGSNSTLRITNRTNSASGLSAISVRELPGNHATQSSEPARPILARVPETGRRNLLERTEEFDDAYWTPVRSTIISDATTAPDGLTTADALNQASGQTTIGGVGRAISWSGTSRTITIYAKSNGKNFLLIQTAGETPIGRTWFNLSTGAVGTSTAAHTSQIFDEGDGWYRCEVVASDATSLNFYCADTDNSVTVTDSGGIYIWGAQLEAASSATAYQKVVDQYDITEAGVTSLVYLAFDGSDDFMTVGITSTFNFVHDGTGMEILAAVTPSNVANFDSFYTFLSNNTTTTANIGFSIAFDDRVSASRNESLFFQITRGVVNSPTFAEAATDTITNFTSPTVLRLGYKEAESPEYFAKENQVSVYSGNSDNAPSASNATSALSIGRLLNGSGAWNGRLFGLLMIDRLLDTGEASNTETYLAAKSGVTL